jgi:hypothetical protein
MASRLFSMTKITGSLWIAAKLMASWKSPGLVDASPPNANTMFCSLRLRIASASPTACGNSVPTQTERVRMRSLGLENWFRNCRPAECVSVAFARTMRNSSSGVTPSTNATPMSR